MRLAVQMNRPSVVMSIGELLSVLLKVVTTRRLTGINDVEIPRNCETGDIDPPASYQHSERTGCPRPSSEYRAIAGSDSLDIVATQSATHRSIPSDFTPEETSPPLFCQSPATS